MNLIEKESLIFNQNIELIKSVIVRHSTLSNIHDGFSINDIITDLEEKIYISSFTRYLIFDLIKINHHKIFRNGNWLSNKRWERHTASINN